MPKYYKDKQGNIYRLLFTAQSIGVQVDFQAYVLEDAKEEKFFCTKYEFDSSFQPCNPPVDWQDLYSQKVIYLQLSLSCYEESFRFTEKSNLKSNFDKDFLNRYEEIKNKILPYTLKRLARYQTNP